MSNVMVQEQKHAQIGKILFYEGVSIGNFGDILMKRDMQKGNQVLTDVGQRASSLAVNTLNLVGSNDDVGYGSSIFKLEHGIGIAAFLLSSAGDSSVEHHHPTIE